MSSLRRAALVLLLLLPGGWARGADLRWAVLVGANLGGAGTVPLLYAHEDARKVQDLLREIGSVPGDRATLLLDPRPDQVERSLRRLATDVAQARARGDHTTLLFFYSGHGDGDGLRLGSQRLSHDALLQALDAVGADVRLSFLDACQSGAGARSKGAARAPSFLSPPAMRSDTRGTVTLTSSSSDEASQENDEIGGSWFTHHLLSALRGDGDTSGDGRVSLEEAYRHVFHRTVLATAETRAGVQHPGFDYDLVGAGDLILTELPTRGAALRFPGDLLGRYLVFDDDRQRFVAEVEAIPGRPSRILLAPGRYRIQRRADDGLREQRVRLAAGDEVAVDDASMRSLSYADDGTKGAVRAAARRAQGRGVSLSVKGGLQAFFDPEIQRSLIPVLPLLGVEFDARGLLGPWTSLRADILLGVRDASSLIEGVNVDVRFSELHGGFGPFVVAQVPGAAWFRPFLGLRVSAIWLHRQFLAPLVQPAQDWFMVTPGLALGLTFRFDERAALTLEGRAHLMVYLDEAGQHGLGHGEALSAFQLSW